MDTTFRTEEGTFNYRVGAIILHEGRVLIMRDEGIPHEYLPGGRLRVGETLEQALAREMREELGMSLPPHRLTFVCESFFMMRGSMYHELGMYYILEGAPEELKARGDRFTVTEGEEIHHFFWVPVEQLKEYEGFVPMFLKERITSLPEGVELITQHSDRIAW